MVKKLALLGFILVVVAAAGMVWAGSNFTAPQPQIMPASAPACVGAPAKVKAPGCAKKLTTSIKVKMSYPRPAPPMPPPGYGCGRGMQPPIPVAVPMWKFVVPWPPFVYYLPIE
jgi:hypothetical protein